MGCGCNGGGATAAKTVIKYEFNGQQFTSKADAQKARDAAGGGSVRTVAVRA